MPVIPAGTQGVDIQVVYLVSGQLCYNNFRYYCEDSSANFAGVLPAVLSDWVDGQLGLLRNLTTDEVSFLEARLTGRGSLIFGQGATQVLNLDGTVEDHTMPPHDTLSFRVYPDLANQLPEFSDPLKPGRIPVSGFPESFQDDGIVSIAGATAISAFAVGIIDFSTSATGVSEDFRLRVIPDVGGVNPRQAAALSVAFNRIGTQLTRKR